MRPNEQLGQLVQQFNLFATFLAYFRIVFFEWEGNIKASLGNIYLHTLFEIRKKSNKKPYPFKVGYANVPANWGKILLKFLDCNYGASELPTMKSKECVQRLL
jgi:hypothetical protein